MLLYRLLMACLLPFLMASTLAPRWPHGTLRERLGSVTAPPNGFWLHAASLGEVTSARSVITALAQHAPVHVTTNTATARHLVQGWRIANVTASLAPFDTAGAAQRLIAQLRPRALITVENEFWPARFAAARAAGIPIILIGARMSETSARRWATLAPLMRPMLASVTLLSAQDAASEARFLSLGLSATALAPRLNLKAGITPRTGPTGPVPRDRTLLAASTHAGEDALILDAFLASRARFDQLILAPRHPERSAEIARLITARGLTFAQRSTGAVPLANHTVFLADTTGEMELWLPMAGTTIIGGTFVPKGGHTPYEPAAFGSALIHGPSTFNFAEPFAALTAANAAIAVTESTLASTLQSLTPDRQLTLVTAAQSALGGIIDLTPLVAMLKAAARPAPDAANGSQMG